MAASDLLNLAEAQREAVRALAALIEQVRGGPTAGGAVARGSDELTQRDSTMPELVRELTAPSSSQPQREQATTLERALEVTARVVSDLDHATRANTEAMGGLSRELAGLPGLLAGLVGGVKDGGSGFGGFLKSGLGLVPLGFKVAGLFRNDERQAPPPLPRFAEPPSVALEVANTDNILAGFPPADRGQRGEPRATEPQKTVVLQPQVTVNVSAMDSQSFLDRSGDIARAVREAMLHMHPVNDLINEL